MRRIIPFMNNTYFGITNDDIDSDGVLSLKFYIGESDKTTIPSYHLFSISYPGLRRYGDVASHNPKDERLRDIEITTSYKTIKIVGDERDMMI